MSLRHLAADRPKRPIRFELVAALFLSAIAAWNLAHPVPFKRSVAPNRLQQAIVERIDVAFDPPIAPWVAGLLLGDDSGFSARWKEIFRRTGTTHLTAVSGYNVALVLSAVQTALMRLPFGRRLRNGLGLLAVAGFVVLTGHPASVLRAALMLSLVTIVRETLGRPVKPLRALLLAVLALTLVRPRMLTDDRGFQLSVLAAFGLAALAPPLEATVFRRLPRQPREWAAQTLAATVMTAPLIAWMTGRYSLVALAANIVAAFFIPSLMAIGAAITALAFISAGLASFLAGLFSLWLYTPLAALRLFAAVPGASLTGGTSALALVAVEAAAIFFAVRWWFRSARTHFLHVEEDRTR
jgi:competence protein ComEC